MADAPTPERVEGPLATARLTVHHLRSRPGCGAAPRVLLLGGSNFDLRLKRSFLDSRLAACCDLATYEPRGIGRTDQPPGDWTMADYAQDAAAVLDALGWQGPVGVVAESFGGMTALHLAATAPERVSALLIASASPGGAGGASYDIRHFLTLSRRDAARAALLLQDTRLRALEADNPTAFAALVEARHAQEEQFADPSIRSGGYARLLEARRRHDAWEVLKRIQTPALILAGRDDGQASATAQAAMAARLPHAQFREEPGGHGLLFSNLDLCAELVDNWLLPRLARAEDRVGAPAP